MKTSSKKIIDNLVNCYPHLLSCYESVTQGVYEIVNCYKNDNKILVCGNGGSAADALHIVGELMKSFVLPRKLAYDTEAIIREVCKDSGEYLINNLQGSLPAISLVNETSLISAYSNDMSPDLYFAQQVFGYGKTGDILIAISTSGNSKNVIYACEIAKVKNIKVIALTGNNGGKLQGLSDVLINVPENETYKIQELHLPVYHAICLAVENEFFGI